MPVIPDPNFRPNPDRAIYITGKIDEAQVNHLAPLIAKIRHVSNEPITVYINSNGGITYFADVIWGLLKNKDLNENSPRIITVAVGNAKSAAADLLAYGDYSYACQHASILFHGNRIGTPEILTAEASYYWANSLGAANEAVALRLANASVQRLVLQYAILNDEFNEIRKNQPKGQPPLPDIECFAKLLEIRTQSDWAKKAVRQSITKCIRNDMLSDHVFGSIEPTEGESPAEYDCKILRAILDFELLENEGKNWKLDEDGVANVMGDYLLLRDYHLGGHTNKLASMVRRFWRVFLTPDEITTYEQDVQVKAKDDVDKWRYDMASPRIRPFWYYAVSMWRALQTEDFSLSPNDAYRLGVVDEVYGLRRPCYRLSAEEKLDEPKSAPPSPPIEKVPVEPKSPVVPPAKATAA